MPNSACWLKCEMEWAVKLFIPILDHRIVGISQVGGLSPSAMESRTEGSSLTNGYRLSAGNMKMQLRKYQIKAKP